MMGPLKLNLKVSVIALLLISQFAVSNAKWWWETSDEASGGKCLEYKKKRSPPLNYLHFDRFELFSALER